MKTKPSSGFDSHLNPGIWRDGQLPIRPKPTLIPGQSGKRHLPALANGREFLLLVNTRYHPCQRGSNVVSGGNVADDEEDAAEEAEARIAAS